MKLWVVEVWESVTATTGSWVREGVYESKAEAGDVVEDLQADDVPARVRQIWAPD